MPLKRCSADGVSGWKWGDGGKCYTGSNARKKALAQGIAMGDIDISKHGENTMWEKIKEIFKGDIEPDELKLQMANLNSEYFDTLDKAETLYLTLKDAGLLDSVKYLPIVQELDSSWTNYVGSTEEDTAEVATVVETEEQPLPGRGRRGAKVAFVSASPSKLDTIRKRPFSGMVGKTLEELYIQPLELKEDDVYMTTIVKEYIEDENGNATEPSAEQIAAALPAFVDELRDADPMVIVALGKTAHRALKDIAAEWVPHPRAIRIWGNTGEVERKMHRLKKSLDNGDVHLSCEIVKHSSPERQIVYGVVMEPNENDTDFNWTTADEIEKAAHHFMENYRMIDTNHSREEIDAVPVESWVTPEDTVLGGKPVKAGSWVMGVHVADPVQWEKVKAGEYTGFSIDAMTRIDPGTILVS